MIRITAKGTKEAEILIYEDIGEGWFGGVGAKRFADELKALGALDRLTVRINSYGGSVFDGFAIYNTLRRHAAEKLVTVDGVAASSASVIAMAGDTVEVAENGFLMIHNPWTAVAGFAADLRKEAELLDQVGGSIRGVYARRTGQAEDAVQAWMDAETWFDAAAAVEHGFADRVGPEARMAACADAERRFKNAPARLRAAAAAPAAPAVDLTLERRRRARLAQQQRFATR